MNGFNLSIDNLTIVGTVSTTTAFAVEQILKNELVEKSWLTSNARFHYNITLIGGGYIQLEHDSAVDSHTKMKERRIRFDFNPNKIRKKYEKHYFQVLSLMYDVHITRKDYAIDLYGTNLSDGWNIYDLASRKQVIYKSGIGRIETVYLGAGKSEEVTRIYNKALEQGRDGEMDWWRVETQLRGKKAQIVGYPAFSQIKITRKGSFKDLPVQQRAMLYFLQDNIESLTELSHASRLKYKKLLANETEKIELIPLNEIFASYIIGAEEEISSWLEFTKKAFDPMERKLNENKTEGVAWTEEFKKVWF